MAVGDVISQISGNGAAMVYQPSSGVEVMVSTIAFNHNAKLPELTNGTNTSFISWSTSDTNPDPANLKIFINNTIYLRLDNLGANQYTAFTGIQIK